MSAPEILTGPWDEDPPSIEQIIGHAVGAGSVCWENTTGLGIFESDRAKQIVEEAVALIKGLPLQASCIQCEGRIWYQDAPTGGWWIHVHHPADHHDAVPREASWPS